MTDTNDSIDVGPDQPAQPPNDLIPAKAWDQTTESGMADEARGNAAARLARGASKGQQGISYTQMPLPAPKSEDEYKLLPAGAEFQSPEGERLLKPWYPISLEEFESVPDGSPYVGPDGVRRIKPTYAGVNMTAQTWYDIARSEKERFKILDAHYPGKVKKEEGTGKLYVDDDGIRRMPGKVDKGDDVVFPAIMSEALPLAGMLLGGRVGGIPGVAGGAMLGEGANALLMQLGGYYDRTGDEALSGAMHEAAYGVAGELAGRTVLGMITAWPAVREIARGSGAKVAASFLGVLKDDIDMATSIAQKGEQESKSWLMRRFGLTEPGAIVPISTWAKGSPALQNIVDAYEQALDTSNPMMRSITEYYKRAVEGVFKKMGIKTEGDILKPEAAIPARETGEAIIAKARQQAAETDAVFQSKVEAMRLAKMREQTSIMPEGFNVGEEEMAEAGVAAGNRRVFNLHDPEGKIQHRIEIQPGAEPNTWEIASVKNPSRKNKEMVPSLYQEVARMVEAEGGQLVSGRATSASARTAKERAAQSGLTTTERGAQPIRSTPDPKVMEAELRKAHGEAVAAADAGIKLLVDDLKSDAAVFDELIKNGKSGGIGDFSRLFVHNLQRVRSAISEVANRLYYGPSEAAAGGRIPEQSGLVSFARSFYDELPDVFRTNHTPIANQIKAMGGGKDKNGTWLDDVEEQSFAQLRKLKQYFTRDIAWDDLASSTQNGTLKLFAKHVDDVLHDARAVPELKEAARLADEGDAYYGARVGPLNHLKFNAMMRTLTGNLPPTPEALLDIMAIPGNIEMIDHVHGMVGDVIWNGVKAARLRKMFMQSGKLENQAVEGIPEVIDVQRFADQVLNDQRNGLLKPIFGADAEKVQKAAQYLMAREGKMDIPVLPDDTIMSAINRAKSLGEAIELAAKQDPLRVLESEMKTFEKQLADAAAAGRKADPLDFLTEPSLGLVEAANKTLASEDLIIAAAEKFGADGKEFGMLRSLYVRRLLQSADMEPFKTLFPNAKGHGGLEEKTQSLLFPGTTKADVVLLAKEMRFMMDNGALDMARGFAAQGRVNNPWGQLPSHKILKVMQHIPLIGTGLTAAARESLKQVYATVRQVLTSPVTMRWLRKGLEGDYAAKDAARKKLMQMYRSHASTGGIVAGAGESALQNSGAEIDLDALGAERGTDGHYYLPDPARPGKFLHIGPPGSGNM